jgi:para-nitrobenzyl esterase
VLNLNDIQSYINYQTCLKEGKIMSLKKLSAFLFTFFLLIGIILSGCAKQEEEVEKVVSPEPLSDPLKIDTGYIAGTFIGDVDNPIRAYRGIPYAAPPVDELRWKPPQPAAPWNEIRPCVEFSKTPPQTAMPGLPQTPQSEDCLYLNVMTPAKKVEESLPVMVWLHGGGYSSGSGNDLLCNLHRLPQHGVVVVTVTMRLNTFGLLAHPLLTAESPNNSSGNYMSLDMIAALEWVKRNISVFGGDPDNVTIFGESGGGSKVSTLMASPLAKGLFHRAICESGTSIGGFLNGKDLKEMEELGVKLFAKLGVDKEEDPLKAARALPFEKVMEAREAMMKELQGDRIGMGLDDSAVDGWFLPKTPLELFKSGEYNAVPLITIANLGEIIGPGGLLLPQLIPAYVNMHEFQNKAGVKGYAAIFDQVPSKWRSEGAVSTHAMEVLYVFGDYDNRTGWWPFMHGLARASGAKDPNDPGLTEADRKVSEAMMRMWTQFALTGDPNIEGMIQWPVYNKEDDKYMYIAEPLDIKVGFSKISPESTPVQFNNVSQEEKAE